MRRGAGVGDIASRLAHTGILPEEICHGRSVRQPHGPDGLRVRRVRRAERPACSSRLFEKLGFSRVAVHRSKDVALYRQGGDQLHRQQRAEEPRRVLRRRARPSACGMAFRVQATRTRPMPGRSSSARSRSRSHRPDGAAPAGDQGHRRRAALPDRPLRGRQVDLRHRLRVAAGRRPPSAGRRPQAHRSPDAQRLPRPHGVLGGVLREALQLPRDPLLRHQGRVHGADLEGDDRAGRQDPHPAERGSRAGRRADRGVPDAVQRRGHPAHRAALRRPADDASTASRWPACR